MFIYIYVVICGRTTASNMCATTSLGIKHFMGMRDGIEVSVQSVPPNKENLTFNTAYLE